MKLLLDTCTFLWLAQQPDKISQTAALFIDDPGNDLLLSDVSVLEIVMKHSAGKLPLSKNPKNWIPEKIIFHQLIHLPMHQEVIYRSGELPRCHVDPFDRLLTAHAIEHGLTLISPDTPLSDLGASRVW